MSDSKNGRDDDEGQWDEEADDEPVRDEDGVLPRRPVRCTSASKTQFFIKWAIPGLFLFIFVLFQHKFYRKNCGRLRDSNSDRRSRRRAR